MTFRELLTLEALTIGGGTLLLWLLRLIGLSGLGYDFPQRPPGRSPEAIPGAVRHEVESLGVHSPAVALSSLGGLA
jgi:hypothetical protein